MSPTTAIKVERKRVERIRAAFAKYLEHQPEKAIAHANAAFDEANRAERERMPVTL